MCQSVSDCLLLLHKPTTFSSRLTVCLLIYHVNSYGTSCGLILVSHKIPQLSYVSNCDSLIGCLLLLHRPTIFLHHSQSTMWTVVAQVVQFYVVLEYFNFLLVKKLDFVDSS